MMSVFWYYRPDDVEGINISDFQEVLAACITAALFDTSLES